MHKHTFILIIDTKTVASIANTCQILNKHILHTHQHKANHCLTVDGGHLYIYMYTLVICALNIDHTINT